MLLTSYYTIKRGTRIHHFHPQVSVGAISSLTLNLREFPSNKCQLLVYPSRTSEIAIHAPASPKIAPSKVKPFVKAT